MRKRLHLQVVAATIFALLLSLPGTSGSEAEAQAELVVNGGFENGTEGWGYEQWENKPLPGVIDRQIKKEGTASFKMGLTGAQGTRWICREIKLPQAGQAYILRFWLRTQELAYGSAYVRVGIEGAGWLGADKGASEIIRVGGSSDWREFVVPIHASQTAKSTKLSVFFYQEKIGEGALGIDGLSLQAATEADLSKITQSDTPPDGERPVFTADTNHPVHSIFALGEEVKLIFRATGLVGLKTPLTLSLAITDQDGAVVKEQTIPVHPDSSGIWKDEVVAPGVKLGFYRVAAILSNGGTLAEVGSRPAGYLTYIVVPRPETRVDYGEERSRFGMQGGPYQGDACSLMGVRWVLDDGLFWRRTEPTKAGEFDQVKLEKFVSGDRPGNANYRIYALPTLFVVPEWATVPGTFMYETGTLTPAGESAWAAYCKQAASAFSKKYPGQKRHIYQITWEPIRPWGFKGTDADLLRIYAIAYAALHESDHGAVVAGPCRGIFGNGDPRDTETLLRLGLGKYLDAYITHPYHTVTPEADGMIQSLRKIRKMLGETCGKDLPMYGSEQGLSTHEDPAKEMQQAQALMRQNLITLGEGFQFNFAFTFYDYRLSGQKGYGYFYNLDKGVPFGPHKFSPKPAAAAYATQSWLLEGSDSCGAVEWLGGSNWGYVFQRPDHTVTLALWNYGAQPGEVVIPAGTQPLVLYDWMGNAKSITPVEGTVKLRLSQEPVYLQGLPGKIWGKEAANLLVVQTKRLEVFPGQSVTLNGSVLLGAQATTRGSVALEPVFAALPPVTQEVQLGGSTPQSFLLALKALPTWTPGEYILPLRLRDENNNVITATGITLEVRSPLSLSVQGDFDQNNVALLRLSAQEQQGLPLSGSIDVRLQELLPGAQRGDQAEIDLRIDQGKTREVPHAQGKIDFELSAKASQELTVAFSNAELAPARKYLALMRVTTKGGSEFTVTTPVHFFGAIHREQPPVIDGQIQDWPLKPVVDLTGPGNIVRSAKEYVPGYSAALRYGWDERALYLCAEVKDKTFIQNQTGADIWRQDCLQLGFDLDPAGAGEAGTPRRTSEINVALTKNGPEAFRSLSFSQEKLPCLLLSKEQAQVAVVRKEQEGVLVYEIALPWKTLGMSGEPKAGSKIGVAVTVNDVHTAGQGDPCALGLFGGITPDKNPDRYGILILR